MAHFCKIDQNNKVVDILVIDNAEEHLGVDICNEIDRQLKRPASLWLKTSYNTYGGQHRLGGIPFRKNYGAVGFTYDAARDAFIPPKPFPSWTLNEDTCLWNPPVSYPTDGKRYRWDEPTVSWVEVTPTT